MMRRSRTLLSVSLLGATAFLACNDALSSGDGGLAITAQFSESAANASFDAARVRIIGPTNRTVNTTPGAEEVIEGLAPGQYRVVLEGLEGSEVELFGQQNNVAVTAGNTTDVTVTFSSFVPQVNAVPTTSPTLRFEVTYGAVPGALGYVIEWDTDGSFANPNRIPVTSTTAEVPGVIGDVYVRVRAATEFATFGAASDVHLVDVDPVVASVAVSPADLDTLIGQGDTVQFSAAGQDANGDEFAGPTFSWTTSDGAVAMVDSEGRVIAQGNGTADIIAMTTNGVDGSGLFTSATMQADSGLFFPYVIPFRPNSIAWDGTQYWTVNGGNAASGRIKTYDENGNFLDSLVINFDARGIFYRESDATVYLKNFGLDWFRLDQSNGTLVPLETGVFADFQSAPDLTPNGEMLVEHVRDSLRLLDFATKTEQELFTGLGGIATAGNDVALATDGQFIYTWDAASIVYVHDFQARLVTTFPLPVTQVSPAGWSISFTNGMLWVIDTGSSTGTWYGFKLRQAQPGAPLIAGTHSPAGSSATCDRSDTMTCQ